MIEISWRVDECYHKFRVPHLDGLRNEPEHGNVRKN